VRKAFLPLTLLCALSSFTVPSVGSSRVEGIKKALLNPASALVSATRTTAKSISHLLYDSLNLSRLGLTREALEYAYTGQQKLVEKGAVENPDVLTVCDFSQPSNRKRMYILDLRHFRVLLNTYVAHGKNSGLAYASRFSNRPESHQSSLGFYVTGNTYHGEHGLSLRLSGMERGFNDKAESRAVVVHGANYIGEGRRQMGRSFGCPAVPQSVSRRVINLIKQGSCLFIYHPSKSYLHGSSILNG
jgi:hypothetical protein